MDAVFVAGVHAVVTRDAAGEINRTGAQVNALRFAGAQAGGTFAAGALVNLQPERRPLRKPAQQRADGTNRVAVKPPAPRRQHGNQHEN